MNSDEHAALLLQKSRRRFSRQTVGCFSAYVMVITAGGLLIYAILPADSARDALFLVMAFMIFVAPFSYSMTRNPPTMDALEKPAERVKRRPGLKSRWDRNLLNEDNPFYEADELGYGDDKPKGKPKRNLEG